MQSVKNKAYIAKQKHTLRCRKLTSDLAVGKVDGAWGHDRCMGFRGTKDYV